MTLPIVLVNCHEFICEEKPSDKRRNDSFPKALALNGNYKVGSIYKNL